MNHPQKEIPPWTGRMNPATSCPETDGASISARSSAALRWRGRGRIFARPITSRGLSGNTPPASLKNCTASFHHASREESEDIAALSLRNMRPSGCGGGAGKRRPRPLVPGLHRGQRRRLERAVPGHHPSPPNTGGDMSIGTKSSHATPASGPMYPPASALARRPPPGGTGIQPPCS